MTVPTDQSQQQPSSESASPLKFHIRQFTPTDQSIAVKIFVDGQTEFDLAPEYYRYALAHDFADIEANYVKPERSNFWCAVDDVNNEVIGVVGVRPMIVADRDYYDEVKSYEDRSSLVPFDPDNCAELNRMAVAPRARRSGVARALLQHLVKWCHEQGYPYVHLTTLVTMRHAFNFYLRCGWTNYRVKRACYESDPRMQTAEMLKRNAELRAAGKGDVLEPKFNVPASEVPFDKQELKDAQTSGILWVAHFVQSTDAV